MTKLLASLSSLALASGLGLTVACSDRTPQVIAIPATAAAPHAQPGAMTVAGTATLEVSPDCADMTMTLSADGARAGVAATALAKKQQAVIAAMQQLGIGAGDIKLSHVTLNPIYRHYPHELKVATYRAEITITVTTKKFDQVPGMMEAAANAGASSVSTAFRRSDLPELKKRVREMALRAAREKAELTAKTLGIELGRVTTVAEVPAGHMWRSAYFPNYVANVRESAPASASVDQAAVIGAASQTLTLDISISYELARET